MRKRLGELLIDAGLLDEHQLQAALGHQRQWGGRLGQALVHMQLISEERMVRVLALQLGIPVADPPPDDLHGRVLGEISLELARQHHIFPLALRRDAKGEQLAIAMSDPTNVATLDAIQFTTGKKVVPYIAGDAAIEGWIRRYYQGERAATSGLAGTVAQANAQMGVQFGGQTVDLGGDDDIPVVTGAIVGTPAADPFAALAASSPTPFSTPSARFAVPGQATPAAFARATPSGRFGQPVAISGVATQAFSGTGALAPLAPLTSVSDADAWARHVEQPAAVFGAAGGFLGASDDDDPALTAAFSVGNAAVANIEPPPAADPFAQLTAAISAPQAAPQMLSDEVELELTDAEEPLAVPAFPTAATAAAVVPVAAASTSWGDLLDVPAQALKPAPEPVVEPAPATIDFATLPATVAPTEHTCARCANERVVAARFCPFCGLSFVDIALSSGPVEAVALPVVEEVALAPAAAPVASIDDRPIELSAGFTIDVLELDELPAPSESVMPAPVVSEITAPPASLVVSEPVAESVAPVVTLGPVDSDWSDLIDDAPPPMPIAAIAPSFAPMASTAIGLTDGAADVEAIEISAAFPVAPSTEAPREASALVADQVIGSHAPSDSTDSARAPTADDLDVFESIEISVAFPVAAPFVAPVVDTNEPAPAAEPLPMSLEDLSFNVAVEHAPNAPTEAPDESQAPFEAPPLVDLAAIGLTPAEAPADVAPTLADQWADAAERQIPRKESDRRNDVGWVPPSRELVVIPEPAAPAPEPVAAYTPAAPPAVVAAVAPWAVFATTTPPVEPTPAIEPAAVPADASIVEDAEPEVVGLPSTNPLETQQNPDAAVIEAIALPALDALPEASEPESIPLPSTHMVGAVLELNDGDLGELDDLDIADVSDVSDVSDAVEARSESQLDGLVAPEAAAIELVALVDAAPVDAAAEHAPLAVGWGDLVDPVVALQAEVLPSLSPLAGITVPSSLLPPATVTPPAFVSPDDLSADIACVDLPLPLMPPPTADDDDPFNVPLAPIPAVSQPPAKVTATMVMKLDPAEQKRLLEMLLSRTELSPTELSQPPQPADPDEQT